MQDFYILVMGRENDIIHSITLGRADANSIPPHFVGMVIFTKLLGTVYFDKSCFVSVCLFVTVSLYIGFKRSTGSMETFLIFLSTFDG